MGLFMKTSGKGWHFDKKTGTLTIDGYMGYSSNAIDPFKSITDKVRSVVALPGAEPVLLSGLFYGMKNLVSADVKHLDISDNKYLSMLFSRCTSLTSLDLSAWDVGHVETFKEMFYNCGSLQTLNLTGWRIGQDADTTDMFTGIPGTARIITDDPTLLALLPEGQRPAEQKPVVLKPVDASKKEEAKREEAPQKSAAPKTVETPKKAEPENVEISEVKEASNDRELKITYENYEQEVVQSDKPVLLDFWAEWCSPCKMMAPVISQIAEEYEDLLKVGKINVDEEEELAMKFPTMSMPMYVLVKNGEVAATTVGFQPKVSLEVALGLNELKEKKPQAYEDVPAIDPKKLLRDGRKTEEDGDIDEALDLYEQAAEMGDAEAMYAFADLSFREDYLEDADEWASRAKASGKLPADVPIDDLIRQIDNEKLYYAAQDAEKAGNHEEAFRLCQKAADRGDSSACRLLASYYEDGIGVKQSEVNSFRYYLKAAELDDAKGMYEAALRLHLGKGVTADDEKALYWAGKARESRELMFPKYNDQLIKEIEDSRKTRTKSDVHEDESGDDRNISKEKPGPAGENVPDDSKLIGIIAIYEGYDRLLSSKVRETAARMHLNWRIVDISLSDVAEKTAPEADFFLVHPQVRYIRNEVKRLYPLALIDVLPVSLCYYKNDPEEIVRFIASHFGIAAGELNTEKKITGTESRTQQKHEQPARPQIKHDFKPVIDTSKDEKEDQKILVNIFSPMCQEEIKKVLEANEKPKYVYVRDIERMTMQFEVTNTGGVIDVASYAKKLITFQPWGRALFLTSTIDGQEFRGGKIR